MNTEIEISKGRTMDSACVDVEPGIIEDVRFFSLNIGNLQTRIPFPGVHMRGEGFKVFQ